MSETCQSNYLPASGFTNTSTEHYRWAGTVVKEARSLFGDSPVQACVWPYREQGLDYLSCDLFSGEESLPVTICVCGETYFPEVTGGAAEADVCDMPDAIHLAGMITKGLGAEVVLGRSQNEVNEDVLAKPLVPGHTNGPIDLSFKQTA